MTLLKEVLDASRALMLISIFKQPVKGLMHARECVVPCSFVLQLVCQFLFAILQLETNSVLLLTSLLTLFSNLAPFPRLERLNSSLTLLTYTTG